MVESVPGPETLPQRQRRRRLSLVRGRDGACFLDLRTRGRISEKRWLAKVWDRRLRQYRTKGKRSDPSEGRLTPTPRNIGVVDRELRPTA